jgi:hypothetical protein
MYDRFSLLSYDRINRSYGLYEGNIGNVKCQIRNRQNLILILNQPNGLHYTLMYPSVFISHFFLLAAFPSSQIQRRRRSRRRRARVRPPPRSTDLLRDLCPAGGTSRGLNLGRRAAWTMRRPPPLPYRARRRWRRRRRPRGGGRRSTATWI